MSELNNELLALREARNKLDAQVITLQSNLDILDQDLSQAQDREQRLLQENAEVNLKKSELEKTGAKLKSEANLWRSKHDQLASSSGLDNVKINAELNTKLSDLTKQNQHNENRIEVLTCSLSEANLRKNDFENIEAYLRAEAELWRSKHDELATSTR